MEEIVKSSDSEFATEFSPNLTQPGKSVQNMYLSCGNHTDYETIEDMVHVPYCPRCDFPVDFCDFGNQWKLCEPFALSNYPQYYTRYIQNETQVTKPSVLETIQSIAQETPCKAKKKEPAPNIITIQCVARAKHKMATVIYGLDAFGIKLDSAAKIFKKKFACGSSAVKGLPGQKDHVEIQGDFESEVASVLCKNFKEIPADSIVHLKHK
ncbi:uncharacterized protein LOC128883235 isoform X5 [Hylaeus volcanicus]|uniref:uncharacterized protein LOC128883235 isoform X5 n=1 Tax=Hylaeus volcanicus TaxID=313075 RepID=UPI0023B7FF35|nr:uncharacterized protein LOC128883235 isoform X5 [Hylaeus volcanicus]